MLTGPQRVSKLTEKARPCIHLYTLSDGDGWMVWDINSQRPMKSRDVIFQEEIFTGLGSVGRHTEKDWDTWELEVKLWRSTHIVETDAPHNSPFEPVIVTVSPDSSRPSTPPLSIPLADRFDQRLESSIHNPDNVRHEPLSDEQESQSGSESTTPEERPASPSPPAADNVHSSSPSPEPVVPRRGTRARKPVDRYGYLASAMLLGSEVDHQLTYPTLKAMVATTDPATFLEATRGVDKEAWLSVMNSEMESLLLNKVFDLVLLPKGKRAIGCKWHFKTKSSEKGLPGRKKAQLVAKGYLQRKGFDYQETYAPSTRHETIRLIMSKMAVEACEKVVKWM